MLLRKDAGCIEEVKFPFFGTKIANKQHHKNIILNGFTKMDFIQNICIKKAGEAKWRAWVGRASWVFAKKIRPGRTTVNKPVQRFP